MDPYWRGRDIKTLWALVLTGIAYGGSLYFRHTITGSDLADGIIGVVLGLYICSHPAANLVDMLFFRRSAPRPFSWRRSTTLWLALNILLLLTGWVFLFSGTTRLIGRPD